MAQSKWKCTQYDRCEAAKSSKEFTIAAGGEFICPSCGGRGGIQVKQAGLNIAKYVPYGAGVALLGLVVWLLMPPPPPPSKPRSTPIPGNGLSLPPSPLTDPDTGLPRRILTRPQAKLLASSDSGSNVVRANIPDFSSYYVYKTTSQSPVFHQVGTNDQTGPEGWIQGDDAVEWKNTLVMDFAPLERRHPVLMFDEVSALDAVLTPEEARAGKAGELYKELNNGKVPLHVIGKEPERYLGATKQFYLLPILDWSPVNLGGQEGKKLKINAAAKGRGKVTPTQIIDEIRRDPKKVKNIGKFKMDLLFVMDSTGSMQPYFDETVKVMREVSQWLKENANPGSSIQFGLWCYQDAPTLPRINYRTKNFTPSLQGYDDFVRTLATVKANKPTPDSYPEDVFAGVMDGITKTPWTEGAARVLILIGDAPANPVNNVGNAYRMEAAQVGQTALDHKVKITGIHIRDFSDPNFVKYHPIAEEQWKMLAERSGAPGSYQLVEVRSEADKGAAFGPVVKKLTTEFATQIADLLKGNAPAAAAPAPQESPKGIVQNLLKGAVVEWVSARSEVDGELPAPPRDITAWVLDRDLADPAIQSLEPKILLTKNQLSDLKIRLSRIVDQAKNAQIMNEDFIKKLKETALAQTQAGQKQTGAGGGGQSKVEVLPKYLLKLPYRSELMSYSSDYGQKMTNDQLEQLIHSLESKVSYYQELHDNPSKWSPLNDKSSESDYVTAVPMSQLP